MQNFTSEIFIQVLNYYKIKHPSQKEEFLLLCPFHTETKPSFYVKGGYAYCFGCGGTWDAIGFIREKEGCNFSEAQTILQKILGVSFSKEKINWMFRRIKSEADQSYKRGLILKIEDDFINFYKSFPNWRKLSFIIDWLWEEFDQLSSQKNLTIENIDHIKDWYFKSTSILRGFFNHWKNLPLLEREIRGKYLDLSEDLGVE